MKEWVRRKIFSMKYDTKRIINELRKNVWRKSKLYSSLLLIILPFSHSLKWTLRVIFNLSQIYLFVSFFKKFWSDFSLYSWCLCMFYPQFKSSYISPKQIWKHLFSLSAVLTCYSHCSFSSLFLQSSFCLLNPNKCRPSFKLKKYIIFLLP